MYILIYVYITHLKVSGSSRLAQSKGLGKLGDFKVIEWKAGRADGSAVETRDRKLEFPKSWLLGLFLGRFQSYRKVAKRKQRVPDTFSARLLSVNIFHYNGKFFTTKYLHWYIIEWTPYFICISVVLP